MTDMTNITFYDLMGEGPNKDGWKNNGCEECEDMENYCNECWFDLKGKGDGK